MFDRPHPDPLGQPHPLMVIMWRPSPDQCKYQRDELSTSAVTANTNITVTDGATLTGKAPTAEGAIPGRFQAASAGRGSGSIQ